MISLFHGSAHRLDAIPDRSVHVICTSPPYYGLRSYAGDQDVEWPTVVFRLNEWTAPIAIQGCEPGCEHDWMDGPVEHKRGSVGASRLEGGPVAKGEGRIQNLLLGRYCVRCGGWKGPLGHEPSLVAYIGHLILCLREWKRVLREDGVCFVNLGDAYFGGKGSNGNSKARRTASERGYTQNNGTVLMPTRVLDVPQSDVKPKDLLMIPAMFAMAARADGWYLRSEIIWAKGVSFLANYAGSVLPESVTDRPTRAHEQIFVLTKSPKYFWDRYAVREEGIKRSSSANMFRRQNPKPPAPMENRVQNAHRLEREDAGVLGRNLRTVWVINPQGYKDAHYAVWPEKLVEPMIKAASSERGVCPACGAPWERVGQHKNAQLRSGQRIRNVGGRTDGYTQLPAGGVVGGSFVTLGWLPSCKCYGGPSSQDCKGKDLEEIRPLLDVSATMETVPATVLDPFVGSGTTLRVAVRLGRRGIGVDLSREYLAQHVAARTDALQMEFL